MLCVVIPAFNEADNLRVLLPTLHESLTALSYDSCVIVVNDGSFDNTSGALEELASRYPNLRSVTLRRNLGKARALQIGFQEAINLDADTIVMMDADGQDDPSELGILVEALEAGNDLVTGARLDRNDRFMKRHTSRWFNKVTGFITKTPGLDFNSGYKVMRRPVAEDISFMLYGELHRYITVIAHWLGYRTVEVPVKHHRRKFGKTKYGINRYWRGFLDLITVRFLMSYRSRPSHLFGGLGFLALLLGSVMLGYLFIQQRLGASVGDRPMLIAGVLMVVTGLQLLLFGLLAELVVFSRNQKREPQ